MAKIAKAEADDLGVKLTGSPQKGQTVEMAHAGALCKIFGTSDNMQAEALLSQCFKPLKADEASDDHPGHDERIFMLSIIRDLAPRDAVERMLVVQMAATHVATIRSARWLAVRRDGWRLLRTFPKSKPITLGSTSWPGHSPRKWRRCASIAPVANKRWWCST